MAVTGNTLEVGVELEVFHRVFVVALHEADGRDLLADDPKDPKGDLVFVRAHHLDSTAVGLEHGRVVDPHPIGVGDRRLLVGVDGSHVEARVASAKDVNHVLGASPLLILRLIEIRQLHIPAEVVHDALGLLRGGEDPLPREIEVRVVEHEGNVGENQEAERRDHDADDVAERRESPEARLQGKPQAKNEEDGERDEPAQEPDRVRGIEAIHRQLAPRQRPNAQEQAGQDDREEEPHVGEEQGAGGERGEMRHQ